jgi:hypothetical protein
MLDPKQCHKLLMADRTRDVTWITAAIEHLLVANPDVSLFDVETAFRDGACAAYVIATNERFEVALGMLAWRVALAKAGVRWMQTGLALAHRSISTGSQHAMPRKNSQI